MSKQYGRFLWINTVSLWLFAAVSVAQAANFDCITVAHLPASDCEALVAIYNDAGGDEWLNNSNWLNGDPCDWYGVSCHDGRVTRLVLDNNQLKGTLAAESGDLTALTWLQLNNNQLAGTLPQTIGQLAQLNWLRLEDNQFSGNIPAQLGDISELQYLYLSNNQLSGTIPRSFGNLSKLARLYLANNQLTGVLPEEIGLLDNLAFLLLNGNIGLTDALPSTLTRLNNLIFLHTLDTDLCEPADTEFQSWLSTISSLFSDRIICHDDMLSTNTPASATTMPIESTPTPSQATPIPQLTNNDLFDNGEINYCAGVSITDSRSVRVPMMEKPNHLQSYDDPAFGSKVTRITDARFGGVIKTAYNTIQAWNRDESYLILYHTGAEDAGHHLYDGNSYEYIRKLSFVPKDIEQFFWDDNELTMLYYINRTSPNYGDFIQYDVLTDERIALTNFDAICGQDSAPTGGNDVQMMSWDGDRIGLRCANASSATPNDQTFFYTISTDQTSPVLTIGDGTQFEPWYAAQMAPSGQRLLLDNAVLNENMTIERTIDYGGTEHSSLGRLTNGHDGLFTVIFDPVPNGCEGDPYQGIGSLTTYDLETGACHNVIGQQNGYGYPLSGIHHSALSRDAAGWVAMSSVGYGQFDLLTNNQSAPVLFSEIYLANSDPDNSMICRLAHHRSHAKDATNGGYNGYFGEPHSVISPSGTRILFSSDWHDSGSVDVYVVELPIDDNGMPSPVPLATEMQGATAVAPTRFTFLLIILSVIATGFGVDRASTWYSQR